MFAHEATSQPLAFRDAVGALVADDETLRAVLLEAQIRELVHVKSKLRVHSNDKQSSGYKDLLSRRRDLEDDIHYLLVSSGIKRFACESGTAVLKASVPSKYEVDFNRRKSPAMRRYTRRCMTSPVVVVTGASA